ncbi:MAG: cupin domain-containing protein [Lachnospiraceae bacterium]
MDNVLFGLTSEEEKQLIQNRENSPYLRILERDGVSYPIPDLIGSSRLIMVDRDTTGAREVTFGFSEFAGRSAIHKKHSHQDCEEIMYILSGQGVGGVGGVDTLCKAGDTLFVPRGEEHWFYNPFDEPCRFLFLYTKASLKEAGYALESAGYGEIGEEVEKRQESGNNQFDQV